ncbi:MAG TPA: protein kinase [Planctomycetota bacterium]|nr:protein kinase [Planctomycetota bacterium]
MPTARDVNFADAAVEEGLVTSEQAEQCLAEMKHAESIGAIVTLDAVMVKKGLLTRKEADEVLEGLARKRVPRRIAGYEILQTVGRGGMHTVFKARQISMDRMVALKVLSPKLSSQKQYVERLFKEARAVAMLSHENIIQGYDVGEASGYYYFASEFVDGESVAARMAREGKIREAGALAIVEQIALALSYIHITVNMIHGDIKPGNIILTQKGVAKLADLGLARIIGDAGVTEAGTPHYISPEQARGTVDMDIRSDIYSLGATLFHMVTGVPPYAGNTANSIIAKHLTSPIPSPQILTPELSPGTCTLITTMLAKDRNERYQTPDELLQDIRKVRSGLTLPVAPRRKAGAAAPYQYTPPPATFTGAPYRRQKQSRPAWLVPAVVTAAVVVLAVAAMLMMQRGKRRQPDQPVEAGGPGTTVEKGDDREALAGKAFPELGKFAESNPSDPLRVIAACQEFAARWAGTSYAKKAVEMAAAIRDREETEAEATFRKLKAEADKLAADEYYSKAIAVYKQYPQRLISEKYRKAVADEAVALKKKARERTDDVFKKAGELAKKNQLEEAAETLDAARKFGFEDVTKLVDDQQAEYRKTVVEAKQNDAERARGEFTSFLKTVARHERNGSFTLALQECDRFLGKYPALEQTHSEICDEAKLMKAEVENLRDTWKRVSDSLGKAIGETVEFRAGGILLKGNVSSATSDKVTIDINGTGITKRLQEIEPDSVLSLAGVRGTDPATTQRRLMFLVAVGEYDKADEAVDLLGDDAMIQVWKGRISTRRDMFHLDEGDVKAQSALDGLRKLALNKKPRALLVGLYRYKKTYGSTETFLGNQAEYDALRLEAEAGICRDLDITMYTEGEVVALIDLLREYVRWEKDNKCPKTKPCPNCTGKGYTLHPMQCPRCYGRGTITCSRCYGSGWVYGLFRAECSTCLGTGRLRCPTCAGRGIISRKEACLMCDGRGQDLCPICQGTGFKEPIPLHLQKALEDLKDRFSRQADALMAIARDE